MKKVLLVLGIIVVLVIAGIFFVLSRLDKFVEAAIEKVGSEVTETTVEVADVDLRWRAGSASIKGLSVANPDGFPAGDAFRLGDITVDCALESIDQEVMVLDEIRIAAPEVNAVLAKNGKTNIDELRRNVLAHTPAPKPTPAAEDEDGISEPPRIIVRSFVFEKGSISLDGSALGLAARTIELPSFTIEDIGSPDGVLPDEIAVAALSELTRQVGGELASAGVESLIRDNLGNLSVEEATDKAKDLLHKLR